MAGTADKRFHVVSRDLGHGLLACERDGVVVLTLQVRNRNVLVRRVGQRCFEAGRRVVERLGGPRLGLFRRQVVVHDLGRPGEPHAFALYLVS